MASFGEFQVLQRDMAKVTGSGVVLPEKKVTTDAAAILETGQKIIEKYKETGKINVVENLKTDADYVAGKVVPGYDDIKTKISDLSDTMDSVVGLLPIVIVITIVFSILSLFRR